MPSRMPFETCLMWPSLLPTQFTLFLPDEPG